MRNLLLRTVRMLLPGTLFVCISFACLGQAPATAAAPPQEPELKKVFDNYTNSVFQEKVYVHTDKDSYLAGETIWMRAYRMDAMNHLPQYYSGIVYIDILNSNNSLIKRMLVIKTDSCFQATYRIEPGLATGYYDLVAYTNWMQNFDSDFYFRKQVYVYNTLDNDVRSSISFQPPSSNGNVEATVQITGFGGEIYRGAATTKITPYVGEEEQDPIMRNLDQKGEISFPLRMNTGVTGVEVSFQEDDPLKYSRFFELPAFEYKFDVQFMPEGGHLLGGVMQNVGFKAVGPDGNSIDVSGTVVDGSGAEVAVFESLYRGMGSFVLQARAGERYTANVTTGDGHTASFELPAVAAVGIALNTTVRGDFLACRVLFTEGYDLSGLYLGFHSRGKSYRWVPVAAVPNFNLPMSGLPEGILSFFIVNEAGAVFSERIVLVNKDSSPQVNITGLRPSYGSRQRVDVNLEVLYGGNIPMPSEMSVSVIDPGSAPQDKSENILSYVLLSSDIKGKVEDPAYYFDKSINAAERARNADLLMMTQGWKRFDIGTILSKELPRLDYAIELGQNITGQIKRRFGDKAVDNGSLSVMGMNKETNTLIISGIDADENGNFTITDIVFPDSTTFVVQGKQGKRQNVEVVIEPQNFRDYSFDRWNRKCFYDPDKVQPGDSLAEFMSSSGRKYIYENGERLLALDVATVIGNKAEVDPLEEKYTILAGKPATSEDIDLDGLGSIRTWLENKGVEIRLDLYGEAIYIRNQSAIVYIDGIQQSVSDLLMTPVSGIDKIWIFRDGIDMSFVTGGSNEGFPPGIVVKTKYGGISPPRESLAFFRFTPKGYSVPDKFYSPVYGGDSKDNAIAFDERSTVYWNPNVTTGADGRANISFYTTDVSSRFVMTVQGMTDTGLPIYAEIPVNATF